MRLLQIEMNNYGVLHGYHIFQMADRGVTIVLGNNLDEPRMDSNGSGKSTLFEGLDWCDYGEIPKGDTVDSVINEIAGKDCWVKVRHELDDGTPLIVKRGRKLKDKDEPKLRVWVGEECDENEVTTLDTNETQKILERHLGMNRDVFHATVLFGQADVFDFCEATDKKRLEILTTVLQLDQIDEWSESAKAKRKANEEAIRRLGVDLGNADTKLETLRSQSYTDDLESWENQHILDLAAAQSEVAAAQKNLDGICPTNELLGRLLHIPPLDEVGPPPTFSEPPTATDPPFIQKIPYPPAPQQELVPQLEAAPPVPQPEPMPQPEPPPPPIPQGLTDSYNAASAQHKEATDAMVRQRTELERLDAILARHAEGVLECSECGTMTGPDHRTVIEQRRESARAAYENAMGQEAAAMNTAADAHRVLDAATQAYQAKVGEAGQRHQGAILATTERNNAATQAHKDTLAAMAQRHQAATFAVTERSNATTHAYNAECSRIDNEHHAKVQAAHAAHATEEQARQASYWADRNGVTEKYNTCLATAQDKDRQIKENEQARQAAADALSTSKGKWGQVEAQTNPWTNKQKSLDAAILQTQEKRVALGERHDVLVDGGQYFDFWVDAFGIKGLKNYILDSRAQDITAAANRVIYQLTGGTYWIRFETQTLTGKKILSNKTNIRVYRHNRNGTTSSFNYRSWSGGQKRRISLGVALGLASLVATRASKTYDVVIFDEVFKHLDRSGREAVVEMLRELGREKSSVFVIDHDVEFQGAFENRVTMQYLDGKSTILESNNGITEREEAKAPDGVPADPAPRPRRKKRSPARAS